MLELSRNRAPLSVMQVLSRLIPLALFLHYMIALSFSGCEQSVTRRVLATVLSVDGTAEVKQVQNSKFIEITPATLLEIGALIRTATGGTLNVAFLPNTLTSVSENTEIQIADLALIKDGNAMRNDVRARIVRLSLNDGTVCAVFDALPECKSELVIKTPHGELTATSDCILVINVDRVRTRVTCVHGVVATRTGQTFSLGAGYFQEFPSTNVWPQVAADDAQAQRDLMSTMETEAQLQKLARHQRLSKPDFLDR